MFPMDRRVIEQNPVTIEFDGMTKRIRKTLRNAVEARRFYRDMFNKNRDPHVVGGCTEDVHEAVNGTI